MEEKEAPKPINNDIRTSSQSKNCEVVENKEYELNLDKDTYLLKMDLYSNQKISFTIRQTNNISFYYFYKEYSYEELIKNLFLPVQQYDNIKKVFSFYDTAIIKNKVTLIQEKEKKNMILLLKIALFFEDIEAKLFLNEIKLTNEEMLKILFDEIRQIKIKGLPTNNKNEKKENINDNNNNEIINTLIKKNEELEKKINTIQEEKNREIKELKDSLNKYIDFLDQKMKESKIEKETKQKMEEENENFIKQNINVEFKENPQNLKFREILTNNNPVCDQRQKFAVYIGLKDHIEYLVYNNKNNFNLDIMRIKDKTIITTLKGHGTNVIVIRYYLKDNKEEYLLTCDKNKLVIIWDIQNFYNKKYTIQTKYSDNICDALLLFNIFNNDYILLSNYSKDEYSKLYEFKENNKFIRNIYGTNDHQTCFMIPWFYQNKYYIIDCAYDHKISINNLLEDETYANLTFDPDNGEYYCGYLYNDNYLCVSDYSNQYIRIWDLVNKVIYKQINYESSCAYEIIPWNINYAIVGCDNFYVVINITEGKMVKKIDLKDCGEIRGIKKIKLGQLGESLICSDSGNKIHLFSI